MAVGIADGLGCDRQAHLKRCQHVSDCIILTS